MKMALFKFKVGKHVGVSVGSKCWVDLEEVTWCIQGTKIMKYFLNMECLES